MGGERYKLAGLPEGITRSGPRVARGEIREVSCAGRWALGAMLAGLQQLHCRCEMKRDHGLEQWRPSRAGYPCEQRLGEHEHEHEHGHGQWARQRAMGCDGLGSGSR